MQMPKLRSKADKGVNGVISHVPCSKRHRWPGFARCADWYRQSARKVELQAPFATIWPLSSTSSKYISGPVAIIKVLSQNGYGTTINSRINNDNNNSSSLELV
ncbi:unnamed protein product, partial [Polarella glacialis]